MMKLSDIYVYSLRILLGVVLCYICIYESRAQNYINRTFIEDRKSIIFKSISTYNSDYYVVGTSLKDNDPQNYYRIFIGKINVDGQMSKYVGLYDTIPKYFASFHNTALFNTKGELIYAGYAGDSIYKVLFGKMDTSLSNTFIKEYYTPDSYAFDAMDMVQYDSSTYFITGLRTIQSTNNPNVLLIKIDSAGDRIWQKLYGGTLNEYAKSITVLKNGNLMLGSFRYNLSQTNQVSNTWLIEVDTGGNIVRQWFDNDDSTYAAEGLIQTKDGGFVYGALRKGYQTINDVYCYSSIVKLDSNFNMQWEYRDYNISSFSGVFDVEELPDGSIIACGNRTDAAVDYLGGWIIKLSSTGELLWERLYQGLTSHNAQSFLSDIDILPDGSFVAVGQCQQQNAPRQVGWLLKVDSNGCEIENCAVGIEDIEPDVEIKVYPNPFADDVNISIENPVLNHATFTVTNSLGQILSRAENVDLSNNYSVNLSTLPAGLYFINIETKGERIVKRVVKQ